MSVFSAKHRENLSKNHADASGENNPFYGKHHSDKVRKKMKENYSYHTTSTTFISGHIPWNKGLTGKSQSHYGKPTPHIKGAYYKGIWMRSSWEINIAKLLDAVDVEWQYEPQRFYFDDCSYCPDFYCPKFDLWIEVKGWMRPICKKKIDLFRQHYPEKNLVVIGKEIYNELTGGNKNEQRKISNRIIAGFSNNLGCNTQ